MKFIINNKDFTYDIYVNKLYHLKIEEKFIFNKVENFKIYLKTDKPFPLLFCKKLVGREKIKVIS